ncbi:MAG: phosphonate ABC transporter, permease protein PhnE [Desulfotalea sp.]
MVILASSYVYCKIDPVQLIKKRGNGIVYLFGHDITEADKKDAMRQAKKLPKIIIEQETGQEIRNEMKKEGVDNPIEFAKRVQSAMTEKLASLNSDRKETIVQSEYERLLDEKRGGYFPPEIRKHKMVMYLKSLIETIAMAIWGTLLAFVIAVPLSMFAASNTLKLFITGSDPTSRRIRNSIQFGMRRILDICRGFNEFVMALILVAIIGLGPFAGVLALAIHTFGVLGKVFSEGIEAIDPGQVEAVEASGASPVQTISFAVLPQIMPLIVSYSLLRFESNVRSASILGFVGAGGIGFLIFDKINGYQYREVCTIMLLIILTVTIIDFFCGKLRKKFV